MVYTFFDKEPSGSGVAIFANKSAEHKQLAEELHKPIIRSFKKKTVHPRFKDNIWGADLADSN